MQLNFLSQISWQFQIQLHKDDEKVEVIFLALFGASFFAHAQATCHKQGRYNFTKLRKSGFLRLD